MSTQVYTKFDAADQLLLSEGVCCLLDIYHPAVEKWRGGSKSKDSTQATSDPKAEAVVPIVKVFAIKSVCVLPHQSIVVPVEVIGIEKTDVAWLFDPDNIEGVEVE